MSNALGGNFFFSYRLIKEKEQARLLKSLVTNLGTLLQWLRVEG